MAVIENFAALSAKEQREFAEALIKTINTENIFSDDTDFKIYEIEVDDMAGSLIISVENTEYIYVPRHATWAVSDEEDPSTLPMDSYDIDYASTPERDLKDTLKTISAEIEGYTVSVYDVMEADQIDVDEVEVDTVTKEDGGIGSYEYWGEIGYDSRPYLEVSGTIVQKCNCALAFEIVPSDTTETVAEEN